MNLDFEAILMRSLRRTWRQAYRQFKGRTV